MALVPPFLDLLRPLSGAMTAPTFESFLTSLAGWVFARRRTVTGMIVAAARWALDEVGLAVLGLALPLVGAGPAPLAVDDTPAGSRRRPLTGRRPCGVRASATALLRRGCAAREAETSSAPCYTRSSRRHHCERRTEGRRRGGEEGTGGRGEEGGLPHQRWARRGD